MGQMNITIDDEIERRFRMKVSSLGGKKGDLGRYVGEALEMWTEKKQVKPQVKR